MNNTSFWKPEPIHPDNDPFVKLWLKMPIYVSAFGFFIGGIFAFSFDNIELLPTVWRQGISILGSALIVFGSELNTPGTFLEVFKKVGQGNINWWLFWCVDFPACLFSAIGTLCNLAVVFALAITASKSFNSEAIPWVELVLTWGPLLALAGVSFDYIGSLVEWGLSFGLFNARYEKWLEEKQTWEEKEQTTENAGGALVSDLEKLKQELRQLHNDYDNRPKIKCTRDRYFALLKSWNGNGPKSAELAEHQKFILSFGLDLPKTEAVLVGWIKAAGFEEMKK